jgi:endonuclease III
MQTISKQNKHFGINGYPRRIRALHRRLDKAYGPFKPFPKLDAVDELILTVLSQNTNDVNRDKAWKNLKGEFPDWDDVVAAPVQKLENAIRVGGLAPQKSVAIKKILKTIKTQYRSYSLDSLKNLPIDDVIEILTQYPHVGIKTAACVLAFSFGRPVIPVDTHVHRLSMRLGLVTEKSTADQTYSVLMQITPEPLRYPFHVYLIRHGRAVCKSQKPLCCECVLSDLCPSCNC